MKFDLYKPCHDCPFLKKGGIRLTQRRVKEISDAMLDSQGSTFACHKTTIDDDEGDSSIIEATRHCAGALIYSEKQGKVNQAVRIMERLRQYDRKKFMADKKVVASVFDSPAQMLEVNETAFGGKKKRRKA